ncbi:hypothetical protein ACMA0Y_006861, partial [Burkholderia cenocepacia]
CAGDAGRRGGRRVEGRDALGSRQDQRIASCDARITRHAARMRRVTSPAGHGAAAGRWSVLFT